MQLIGFARLGKDAELKTLNDGKVVANMALAYNYGKKGADGKKATQWVDASLWGKLAEVLITYLVKGQGVVVTIDDIRIETFNGKNGPSSKLVGNISALELTGGAHGTNTVAAAAASAKPATSVDVSFSRHNDDVPF